MRITVTTEHHFARTSDGAVFSATGGREYAFWTRYLRVFDEVRVVGRVRDVRETLPDGRRVDGPGVSCIPLPDYTGPVQFLARRKELESLAAEVAIQAGAFILRIPGQVGTLVWSHLRRRQRPYAVEVVGDPYDVLQRGAVRSFLRAPARHLWRHSLRKQCSGAAVAAYVTARALQRRYPVDGAASSLQLSDVDLPEVAYASESRRYGPAGASRLVTVGTLAQMYKGPDVLLASISMARRRGVLLEATWVGDGKHRDEMERMARAHGLSSHIRFAGQVATAVGVRACLDAADVFVLPSRQEGLPRALLEAMARGLPCVATRVGGVPELLDDEALVRPGRPAELAQVLVALCTTPSALDRLAAANLARARGYSNEARATILKEFLLRVRSTADPAGVTRDSVGASSAAMRP